MSNKHSPEEKTPLVATPSRVECQTMKNESDQGCGLRGDILIVFQTLLLPITFIITYFTATALGHVDKKFPYISDTGTWPPESCVFGLLLCFYSLSTFLSVFIRWRLVSHATGLTNVKVNHATFGLGLTASFGVLLVANFQETSQIVVHLIGALMAFFVGTLYMWGQTFLSWKLPEIAGFGRMTLFFRILVTILATLSALLILPFAAASIQQYDGNQTKTFEPGTGKWDPNLGGYDLHIASASFEWALAGLVTLYWLTFIHEFRSVRVGMPSVRLSHCVV